MSRTRPDRLRDVFRRHAWRLLLSALLVLVTMLAGVGLLWLSGSFLTAAALAGVAGMGTGFNFFSPSAGIRALTFARIASRYGEKLIGHDATLRIARDLRVWFFRRALPLAPGRLSATRTGDLLARLMSDIGEVDGLSVRALAPLAALLGIWLAGIAAAALIHLPAAGLLLVLGVLIGGLVPWQVARGGAQREHLRAQQRTALRTQAFEGLEGAADLAAVDAQGAWLQQIDAAAAAVIAGDRIQRRRLITGNLLHAFCAGVGLAGMLCSHSALPTAADRCRAGCRPGVLDHGLAGSMGRCRVGAAGAAKRVVRRSACRRSWIKRHRSVNLCTHSMCHALARCNCSRCRLHGPVACARYCTLSI